MAKAGEELARAILDVLGELAPDAPEVTRARRDRSIRRAEAFFRDHGLYSPKRKKLTKSRRAYIKKLSQKNRDLLRFNERGEPQFLFAPARTKAQKAALKEAKAAGYTVTKKGIFLDREHMGNIDARIGYDRHFRKFYVERIPRPRRRGGARVSVETTRDYFAGFDEIVKEEKKFLERAARAQRRLGPNQAMRFVVYGRHLSRSDFPDAESMLRGFQHYKSFQKNPYDFVTNLRVVIVDLDETIEEAHERLFDDDGFLRGYRGR